MNNKSLAFFAFSIILCWHIKMGRDRMREEIHDRRGNPIYLTDERWAHIVKYHSQLKGRRTQVLSTVRTGKRKQDPLYPDKFLYTKVFPQLGSGFIEIEVVVVFRWQGNKPNNFILTAYPN